MAGLSLGALGSGLLVQFGPDPMRLIFWLLLGGFVVATVIAATIPEPVPVRSRRLASARCGRAWPCPDRCGWPSSPRFRA